MCGFAGDALEEVGSDLPGQFTRLVLELKGKLAGNAFAPAGGAASAAQADILSALMALGYSEREAQASVRALPAEVTVSEGIRLALKALAR